MLWIVSLGEEAKNVRSIDIPEGVDAGATWELLRWVPLSPVRVLGAVDDPRAAPPPCALWDVVSPRDFLERDNAGPVLETLLLGHQRYRRREAAWGVLTLSLGDHLAATIRPGWAPRDFAREWVLRRPRASRSRRAAVPPSALGARA